MPPTVERAAEARRSASAKVAALWKASSKRHLRVSERQRYGSSRAQHHRRPYVARLLRDYELRGWLGDGLRGQLEAALLAPPRSEYCVAVAQTT